MAFLQTDRHTKDQTREAREQSEDEALAQRLAHLPNEEMRSFQDDSLDDEGV